MQYDMMWPQPQRNKEISWMPTGLVMEAAADVACSLLRSLHEIRVGAHVQPQEPGNLVAEDGPRPHHPGGIIEPLSLR
jgi:hypothetical protein